MMDTCMMEVAQAKLTRRSKDLGHLLDTCSWYDKWQFPQIGVENSLLYTKTTEIWANSHTVPHHAFIN